MMTIANSNPKAFGIYRDLGNRLMVKKVEELTLYLIEKGNKDKDQQKAIKQLQIKNQSLEEKFDKLAAQLTELNKQHN